MSARAVADRRQRAVSINFIAVLRPFQDGLGRRDSTGPDRRQVRFVAPRGEPPPRLRPTSAAYTDGLRVRRSPGLRQRLAGLAEGALRRIRLSRRRSDASAAHGNSHSADGSRCADDPIAGRWTDADRGVSAYGGNTSEHFGNTESIEPAETLTRRIQQLSPVADTSKHVAVGLAARLSGAKELGRSFVCPAVRKAVGQDQRERRRRTRRRFARGTAHIRLEPGAAGGAHAAPRPRRLHPPMHGVDHPTPRPTDRVRRRPPPSCERQHVAALRVQGHPCLCLVHCGATSRDTASGAVTRAGARRERPQSFWSPPFRQLPFSCHVNRSCRKPLCTAAYGTPAV